MPCLIDAKISLVSKPQLIVPSTLLALATTIRTYKVTKIQSHKDTYANRTDILELFFQNSSIRVFSWARCSPDFSYVILKETFSLPHQIPLGNVQCTSAGSKHLSVHVTGEIVSGKLDQVCNWYQLAYGEGRSTKDILFVIPSQWIHTFSKNTRISPQVCSPHSAFWK